MEPKSGPREGSGECVHSQKQRYLVNSSSKMEVAFLPGKKASLRADVMFTSSTTHNRMSCAESTTAVIQLQHPEKGKDNQRTAHEKMLFSRHCLNVNTKEMALCQ